MSIVDLVPVRVPRKKDDFEAISNEIRVAFGNFGRSLENSFPGGPKLMSYHEIYEGGICVTYFFVDPGLNCTENLEKICIGIPDFFSELPSSNIVGVVAAASGYEVRAEEGGE